jgi:hypothetical protein
MKPELVVVSLEDWEGLYLNGELATQGHRITPDDVAAALGSYLKNVYPSQEYSDDLAYSGGRLPKLLKEVPIED